MLRRLQDMGTERMARMPPADYSTSGRPASVAALLALLGFSVVLVVLLVAGRLAIDVPAAGETPQIPDIFQRVPFWIALALAAAALGAAWLAFTSHRTRTWRERQLRALGADASRLALGEYGHRVGADGVQTLEPIAQALRHLASLVGAAQSVIEDRDRQLATIRGLGGLSYWETDAGGRFRRLEAEPWQARARLNLVGQPQFERATPVDQARWAAAQAAIADRRPFTDLPVLRPDAQGRATRLLESGSPRFALDGAFLGYTGIVRLDESRYDFTEDGARITVETSSEPILVLNVVDGAPAIECANPAACQLFERGQPELASSRIHDLIVDAGDPGALAAIDAALSERRPLRRTAMIRNRFGEHVEVLARLEPMGATGRALLVVDPRDAELATLRAHALERESLRETLSTKARLLELRTRELEEFSYGVSHDLRAPLRVVEGYAKLLDDDHSGRLDDAGRGHLAHILTGCARMNRMIDGVLALTRVATQPMLEIPVDLTRVAHEVVATLRHAEPTRRVDVRIGENLTTRGDPTLLRSLLENLLGNAWKYTARREVASIAFDVDLGANGNEVFCVSDNGVGFEMRHADRIFDMFQRLHSGDDFPGTGLGLASVREIVRRHGGTIWAESTPGEGSRFFFTMRAMLSPQ